MCYHLNVLLILPSRLLLWFSDIGTHTFVARKKIRERNFFNAFFWELKSVTAFANRSTVLYKETLHHNVSNVRNKKKTVPRTSNIGSCHRANARYLTRTGRPALHQNLAENLFAGPGLRNALQCIALMQSTQVQYSSHSWGRVARTSQTNILYDGRLTVITMTHLP